MLASLPDVEREISGETSYFAGSRHQVSGR